MVNPYSMYALRGKILHMYGMQMGEGVKICPFCIYAVLYGSALAMVMNFGDQTN